MVLKFLKSRDPSTIALSIKGKDTGAWYPMVPFLVA